MISRLSHPGILIALGAMLLAGVALRLFQYPDQVLLDDEWHAIHQLLSGKSPGELFLSLGHADYSIPLGLLYWLEMQWFGLNEWAMRWPMLLAGLAMLVALPAWAWSRFPPRVTLIFTGLLAVSPLLLIYTHTARPYAITLLLSLLGVHAFHRWASGTSHPGNWVVLYVVCAALGTWLHAMVGPLLLAPLLLEGARRLAGRPAVSWGRLAGLSALAWGLTALLVVPPLWSDPAGLALKAGEASIGWSTAWGALHSWLGTSSSWIALGLLALAALGLAPLLRASRSAQSLLLGLMLVVLAVLLLRPASVNHPLTFGRYLLAALPVLLISIACGTDRLFRWWPGAAWPVAAGLSMFALVYVWQSPLHELLAVPNSHITHSRFQYDFRPAHNRIARYQRRTLPSSAFWPGLDEAPRDSLLIAAAPFYFETYHWDAPRWERAGGQRVRPVFLTGFCAQRRFGEVPDQERFSFRNVYWLSRIAKGEAPLPDWLVFTKPLPAFAGTREGAQMNDEAQRCREMLEVALGVPNHEDEVLLAWRLGDAP